MDPFELMEPSQDLPTFEKVIEVVVVAAAVVVGVVVAAVAMVAAAVVLYFHLSNCIYKSQTFKSKNVFSYIIC